MSEDRNTKKRTRKPSKTREESDASKARRAKSKSNSKTGESRTSARETGAPPGTKRRGPPPSRPPPPPRQGGKAGIVISSILAIAAGLGGVYLISQQEEEAAEILENANARPEPKSELKDMRSMMQKKKEVSQAEAIARKTRANVAARAISVAGDFQMEFPDEKYEQLNLWKVAMEKAKGTGYQKQTVEHVLKLQQEINQMEGKRPPFPGLNEAKAKAFAFARANDYVAAIDTLNKFYDAHQGYHRWKKQFEGLRVKVAQQRVSFFGVQKRSIDSLIEEGKFAEAKAGLEAVIAQAPPNMKGPFEDLLARLPELERMFYLTADRQRSMAKIKHDRLLKELFTSIEKPMRARQFGNVRSRIKSMLDKDEYELIEMELQQGLKDLDNIENLFQFARANLKDMIGKERTVGGISGKVLDVKGDVIHIESQGVKMQKKFRDLREREVLKLAWGDYEEDDPQLRQSAGILWLYRYETVLAEREFDIAREQGMEVNAYYSIIGVLGLEMSSEEAEQSYKVFKRYWSRGKWVAAGKVARDIERYHNLSRTFTDNKKQLQQARAIYDVFGSSHLLHPASLSFKKGGFVELFYDFQTPVQLLDWTGRGHQPGFYIDRGSLTLHNKTSGNAEVWMRAGLMDIARVEFDLMMGEEGSDDLTWEMGYTPSLEDGLMARFARTDIQSTLGRGDAKIDYNLDDSFQAGKKYHVVTSRSGPDTVVTVNGKKLVGGEYPFAIPGRTLRITAGYHAHLDNLRVVTAIDPFWSEYAARQRLGSQQMMKAINGGYQRGEWVPLIVEGKALGWKYEPEIWKTKEGAFGLERSEDANEDYQGDAVFPHNFQSYEFKGKFMPAVDEVDSIRIYFRRHIAKFQSQSLELIPYRSRAKLRWNYRDRKGVHVPNAESARIKDIPTGEWTDFFITCTTNETVIKVGEETVFTKQLPAPAGRVGVGATNGEVWFKEFEIRKLK